MTPSRVAPRPAAGISLVAGARVPLAFIGFGISAFVMAVVVLALEPELLLLPHTHPAVVALAHLWLPGFLLSVSMGAIYQLMPVVLGAPLQLPQPAAWAHLGLHAMGVALLVSGFALGRFELVALGGTVAAIGAMVLLAVTWRTFLAANRRDAIAWSFPLAVSWLTATMLFGILLALNRRMPFLSLSVVDLLRAHAHLGLGGFFLTLLQGATFQLVPMFTMADLRGERWVRAGVALTQAGLLVLTPGLACGRAAVAVAGAVLIPTAIACSGVALVATFRTRRRRVLEPGLKAFGIGAGVLAACAVGGLALVLLPAGGPFVLTAATAYGATIVAGALSFMILGMLCKIVPFLVWMKTYGPRAGRQPVPLATSLDSRPLEDAWLGLHGAALIGLVTGVLAASPLIVAAGAVTLAAAAGAFLANMVRVLAHLIRPQLAAPASNPRTAISTS
jgi:hypothetical protein